MWSSWKRFCLDSSGAVTVDWVVISAAVIGMGLTVLGPVAFEADSSAVGVADYVSNVPVGWQPQ